MHYLHYHIQKINKIMMKHNKEQMIERKHGAELTNTTGDIAWPIIRLFKVLTISYKKKHNENMKACTQIILTSTVFIYQR